GSTTPKLRVEASPLLDRDGRALLLELLLHVVGLGLRDPFLNRLGRAVDQVLGFLEAEPGQLAHDLDDLDLLLARRAEDDVELGLLLGRRRARPCAAAAPPPPARAPPRTRADRHRRRRRHAPLLLQELGELRRLQQSQLVEFLRDLLNRRHRDLLWTRAIHSRGASRGQPANPPRPT